MKGCAGVHSQIAIGGFALCEIDADQWDLDYDVRLKHVSQM